MHAKHPDIAKRWDKKYGGKIVKGKKKGKRRVTKKKKRKVAHRSTLK
jgi:hypothetical protein